MTTTGGTFTIRTSLGQLFGSFADAEDAWAAMRRARKGGHGDVLDGAQVVPLLAGVTPLPVHPGFLSDAPLRDESGAAPGGPTLQQVSAAADSFVHTYNDSRSAFLGYRYVSAYVVASDRHLREAVTALLAGCLFEIKELTAERDRFRVHSVTLNSVAFAMAEALGDVPPGADQVEGDPVEQVARLVDALKLANGTVQRRSAQLHEACDEVERLTKHSNLFRGERDAARAEVERLRGELAAFTVCPVCCSPWSEPCEHNAREVERPDAGADTSGRESDIS